jgi:hypothetical protein
MEAMTRKHNDLVFDFSVTSKYWMATPLEEEPRLDSAEDGVRLAAIVALARRGALRHPEAGAGIAPLVRLRELCEVDSAILTDNAYTLMGACATERELVDFLEQHHGVLYAHPKWHKQDHITQALFHSKFLWTVPVIIRLWHRIIVGARCEADSSKLKIHDLLQISSEPLPYAYSVFSRNDENEAMDAWLWLQEWRKVRERVGDDHAPIMAGALFDVRRLAELVRSDEILLDRRIYETVTGADCSNWYNDDHRIQRLQVVGEMERFLAEDAHRYEPGKRYCLGQEVPLETDPRAIEHMNEAIAYIEAQFQAIERRTLIDAGLIEDDEDDEEPGFDEYAYADLDNWRADPNGSAWERVALAAQDAVLGEHFRLVDRVIEAIELTDDYELHQLAVQLLGDAGPSEQLRRLPTLADERREDPWVELCVHALANSGLCWALEAAGELMCRLDPETTLHGPPWWHLWRRLLPKIDMELFKLFRSRDRAAIGELIRSKTAAHAPDTVLWAGAPLQLRVLVNQLSRVVEKDPPAPAEVVILRHLLQTMTGVDLSAIWASPTEIDPAGARWCIDKLRAEPLVLDHEAGTRLFMGTPVPLR